MCVSVSVCVCGGGGHQGFQEQILEKLGLTKVDQVGRNVCHLLATTGARERYFFLRGKKC